MSEEKSATHARRSAVGPATQQHGVVTAAQLAELGLSSSGISYRASVGRLHRIRRGVYAVGHRRLSQHGLWMAAVLAVGEGAVLSHLCAAVLWQAWRRTARTLDVLAPRSLRRHRGIRVRRCRSLDSRDVTVHDSVPVTTVARTLMDITDVLTAAQLANVIHEAGFRGRFDLVATRAAMARANGRRVGVLKRALELNALGSAGTKSGFGGPFPGPPPLRRPTRAAPQRSSPGGRPQDRGGPVLAGARAVRGG